jgi:hypothetical protein
LPDQAFVLGVGVAQRVINRAVARRHYSGGMSISASIEAVLRKTLQVGKLARLEFRLGFSLGLRGANGLDC